MSFINWSEVKWKFTQHIHHDWLISQQPYLKSIDVYIPVRMRKAIELYIEKGIIPGDFLTAVICNNLKEAYIRADEENQFNMFAYVAWFYQYAPTNCWGSEDRMDIWLNMHERIRLKEKEEKSNEDNNVSADR